MCSRRRRATLAGVDQLRTGDHECADTARPLEVTRTDAGIRLTGDSDMASRAEFTAALRALADTPLPQGQALILDLSELSFLDAHSAGAVLRLAAALSPPRRLEVRCRAYHQRMLHVLGARSIRQLTIVDSER
jgi:hypothetical protein